MVLNQAGGRWVPNNTPKMNRKRENHHVDDISEAELPTPKSLEERYVWVQRFTKFSKFTYQFVIVELPIVNHQHCVSGNTTEFHYYSDFHSNEMIGKLWKFSGPLYSNIPFFKAFGSWKLSFGYDIDMGILSPPVHFRSVNPYTTTSSSV